MRGILKKFFYRQRARQVADFYDNWSEKFLSITDTLQGFRTENIDDLHRYTVASASLADHCVILDAGCGVGGPAFYFATNLYAQVYALTNSKEQIRIISTRKQKEGIENLHIVLGDYHELSKKFQPGFFSHVLFLESLGHSYYPKKVLEESSHVLRKGGVLYIRDAFKRKSNSREVGMEINRLANRANKTFVYNHLPVSLFVKWITSIGLQIEYCRIPNFTFKSIDEEFEKKLGFPSTRGSIAFVEPFEIKAIKI